MILIELRLVSYVLTTFLCQLRMSILATSGCSFESAFHMSGTCMSHRSERSGITSILEMNFDCATDCKKSHFER